MGEYAKYGGHDVKIGTCEDMYYLRFDQRFQVQHIGGNVNPASDADAVELRFRFPWPDEDHIPPGSDQFHDNGFHRSLHIHGFTAPDVDHNSIQFRHDSGYLVMLPCPESEAYHDGAGAYARKLTAYPEIGIAKNGYKGAVHLVAQKWRPSIGLVPILRCGGCGHMWREEDRSRIEEIAVLLRSEGDRREAEDMRGPNGHPGGGLWWHQIADRVLAGITETVGAK